jgi:hypothetical protein
LMLVPLVTVWFGVFPIVINVWCAIAVTIYYPATMMVMYYTRSLRHLKVCCFILFLLVNAFLLNFLCAVHVVRCGGK